MGQRSPFHLSGLHNAPAGSTWAWRKENRETDATARRDQRRRQHTREHRINNFLLEKCESGVTAGLAARALHNCHATHIGL
jgi:hypothetical protein